MFYLLDRSYAEHPCRHLDYLPYIKGMNFGKGEKITVSVPDPLKISLKAFNRNNADMSQEMPEYFKDEIPLFRDDLIAAMKEAGVNNLDVYDAVITDPDSGKEYGNYKAVNIVGLLPKEVLGKKKMKEMILHNGEKFDKKKAGAAETSKLLIFRIEDVIGIFVDEKLRDHLTAKGFTNLEFHSVDEAAV